MLYHFTLLSTVAVVVTGFAVNRAKRQFPFGFGGVNPLGGNGNGDGFNLITNGLNVGPFYNQGASTNFRPSSTGFGFNHGKGGGVPIVCAALGLPASVCQLQTGTGFDFNLKPFTGIFSGIGNQEQTPSVQQPVEKTGPTTDLLRGLAPKPTEKPNTVETEPIRKFVQQNPNLHTQNIETYNPFENQVAPQVEPTPGPTPEPATEISTETPTDFEVLTEILTG